LMILPFSWCGTKSMNATAHGAAGIEVGPHNLAASGNTADTLGRSTCVIPLYTGFVNASPTLYGSILPRRFAMPCRRARCAGSPPGALRLQGCISVK